MRKVVISLLLTACATAPELPPPLAAPVLGYESAALLTLTDQPTGAENVAVLEVSVQPCLPPTAGTPLDTHVAAFLADRGRPFRGGSPVLRGFLLIPTSAIVAPNPNAPDREDATASRFLPKVSTGVVGATFATRIAVPGSQWPEVLVTATDGKLRLAVRSAAGASGREGALLAPLAVDAEGALAIYAGTPGGHYGVALVLRVGGPAAAEAQSAVRAQLAAEAAKPPTPTATPMWAAKLAQDAVGADPRRRALLALAQRLNLSRGIDLLLAAGEKELITIAEQLPTDQRDAFAVERAMWTALLPTIQRDELSPTLRACMRRHFGVVALDPTTFEFVLANSSNPAELQAALQEQNLDSLDDRQAAQRFCAADWLQRVGQPVPDYDPLAPRADRRAALKKAAAMPTPTQDR